MSPGARTQRLTAPPLRARTSPARPAGAVRPWALLDQDQPDARAIANTRDVCVYPDVSASTEERVEPDPHRPRERVAWRMAGGLDLGKICRREDQCRSRSAPAFRIPAPRLSRRRRRSTPSVRARAAAAAPSEAGLPALHRDPAASCRRHNNSSAWTSWHASAVRPACRNSAAAGPDLRGRRQGRHDAKHCSLSLRRTCRHPRPQHTAPRQGREQHREQKRETHEVKSTNSSSSIHRAAWRTARKRVPTGTPSLPSTDGIERAAQTRTFHRSRPSVTMPEWGPTEHDHIGGSRDETPGLGRCWATGGRPDWGSLQAVLDASSTRARNDQGDWQARARQITRALVPRTNSCGGSTGAWPLDWASCHVQLASTRNCLRQIPSPPRWFYGFESA